MADSDLELHIEASSEKFDAGDANWRDQVAQLHESLNDSAGKVRRVETAVDGKKGGFEQIILALGSAGAFTVALGAFKAWLGRDQTRTVTVTAKIDGKEKKVTLKANRLDQDEFMQLAKAAWNDEKA